MNGILEEKPFFTDASGPSEPRRDDDGNGHYGLVVTSVPKVTLRNLLNINGLLDTPWCNSLRTKRTLLSST
jgi:hypothetical protein